MPQDYLSELRSRGRAALSDPLTTWNEAGRVGLILHDLGKGHGVEVFQDVACEFCGCPGVFHQHDRCVGDFGPEDNRCRCPGFRVTEGARAIPIGIWSLRDLWVFLEGWGMATEMMEYPSAKARTEAADASA